MNLVQELELLARALDDAGVEYALCGGLAMAAHGFVRATEDIDLMIREESLPAARDAVATQGFTIPGGEIPLKPGTADAGLIFRVSKVEGTQLLPLDLMLVTPAYERVWNSRCQLTLGAVEIPVISRTGMIIMKQLGGRPKDQMDLEFLNSSDNETESET